MKYSRNCSRTACSNPAVATLTYVYSDGTAVLGPLAQQAEPHSYDLCATHAERLTAPRGWQVVRLLPEFTEAAPNEDDLLALANAVREAGKPAPVVQPTDYQGPEGNPIVDTSQRRGHLRVVQGDR